MGLTGWDASPLNGLELLDVPAAEPMLFSAWARRTASTQFGFLVQIGQSGTSNHHRTLGRTSTNIQAQSRDTSTASALTTVGAPGPDVWFHAAAALVASNRREAWVDGGSKGVNTTAKSVGAPSAMRIGVNLGTSGAWYQTRELAEVSIWDLTGLDEAARDALVVALANAVNPLTLNVGGLYAGRLAAYWPLPDLDDLTDHSGNGFDLTLLGTLSNGQHPAIDPPDLGAVQRLRHCRRVTPLLRALLL